MYMFSRWKARRVGVANELYFMYIKQGKSFNHVCISWTPGEVDPWKIVIVQVPVLDLTSSPRKEPRPLSQLISTRALKSGKNLSSDS